MFWKNGHSYFLILQKYESFPAQSGEMYEAVHNTE